MLSSRKGGTSDGPEGGTCAASSGASSGATPSMPPPAHLVGDDVELAPALLFNSAQDCTLKVDAGRGTPCPGVGDDRSYTVSVEVDLTEVDL